MALLPPRAAALPVVAGTRQRGGQEQVGEVAQVGQGLVDGGGPVLLGPDPFTRCLAVGPAPGDAGSGVSAGSAAADVALGGPAVDADRLVIEFPAVPRLPAHVPPRRRRVTSFDCTPARGRGRASPPRQVRLEIKKLMR